VTLYSREGTIEDSDPAKQLIAQSDSKMTSKRKKRLDKYIVRLQHTRWPVRPHHAINRRRNSKKRDVFTL
jgi:hypothetical protein